MTESVKCRVCGCECPPGAVECPDCGAPLPREPVRGLETALETEPSPAALSAPEEDTDSGTKAAPSKLRNFFARRPTLGRVSLFLAAALVIQLAAVLWPKKWRPAGMAYTYDRLISQDGTWDPMEDGFYPADITADGRYILFRKQDDQTAARARDVMDIMLSATQSSSTSLTYAPTGDYYLFDGRTLEHTDWTFAAFCGNGAVLYTQANDTGATLFYRDLATGKVNEVQRFEGAGELYGLSVAPDGSAAAYYWQTAEKLDPGAEVQKDYRLWRRKDGKTLSLGDADQVTVGNGGETCLLWYAGQDGVWDWGEMQYGGDIVTGTSLRLDGVRSDSYYLWRDGEVTWLSDLSLIWVNADLSQFILRESQADYSGGWYFLDVSAGAQRPLYLSGDYLAILEGFGQSRYTLPDRLDGQLYNVYTGGGTRIYYLTHQGNMVLAEEWLEGNCVAAPDGQSAVYLKNGELYRVAVHPDDTLETGPLTRTDNLSNGDPNFGSVSTFAVSEDLSHVYYVAQDVSRPEGMGLFHWHNGESRLLDMELAANLNPTMTVTDDGGCYLVYRQELYYTDGTAAAAVVGAQEDMGAFVDVPNLVGPDKWPLALSVEWEASQRQYRCWRLKGYDTPTELDEWYPKEGKV